MIQPSTIANRTNAMNPPISGQNMVQETYRPGLAYACRATCSSAVGNV
jgi:hypothetical protein